MKIISWNVNSVRIRIPILEKLNKEQNPDIICLQETKVQDSEFPLQEIKNLGFDFVEYSGEKSYNGVAILSKAPLTCVEKIDILESGHKRHISAKLPDNTILHNFYVPAGGDIPDIKTNPKFDFKLKFVDWMIEYFDSKSKKEDPIVILGDMNIAPSQYDVWSHKQLLKIISHTPIETDKMNLLQNGLGWIDSHRFLAKDEEKLYSWWSYRSKDPFKTNRGRRLDHIWATPILKDRIKSADILTDYRLEDRPSDHVPIVLELS
jgi:exodeoxyribonuclease-3